MKPGLKIYTEKMLNKVVVIDDVIIFRLPKTELQTSRPSIILALYEDKYYQVYLIRIWQGASYGIAHARRIPTTDEITS